MVWEAAMVPARSKPDDRTWRILKALAHPVRLEIVWYIHQHPGCICNEILLQLPETCLRAQSTLSQHLKILRDAGILLADSDGAATCYMVNTEKLDWLEQQLSGLRARTGASPRASEHPE